MTDEDARSLKPGDRVRFWFGGKLMMSLVDMVFRNTRPGRGIQVVVRNPRWLKTGKGPELLSLDPRSVEFERRPDDGTGSIYADWLEERGEFRAAALLRDVFPFPERAAP